MPDNVVFAFISVGILIMLLYIFYLLDKVKDERISKRKLLIDIEEEKKIRVEFEKFKQEKKFEFEYQKSNFNQQKVEIELSFQKQLALAIERYKIDELEKEKVKITQFTKDTYLLLFNKWKKDFEMTIRNDAKFRSYSTLKGKSAENLLPFYRNFPFNSQDTRFVGSPIDLIIFDGLSEPERDIDIYI